MIAQPAQRQGPSTWDWGFAWDILPELLRGLVVTIRLTLTAMVLAVTVGLVLALLRRSRRRLIRWPAGAFVEAIRSTPLLIQLFFLYFVLPDQGVVLSGFTAAVLGLGIHYGCYVSETFRAGIDAVPRGQWEAATAMHLRPLDTWRRIILPQAIPTVLPALGNHLIASFKDAPLAATITVVGLLGSALRIQGQTFRGLEPFTLAGLLFLSISVPAAVLVRVLERRHGYARD